MSWVCEACEYENEAEDDVCGACDAPRPANTASAAEAEEDDYAHIKVGLIITCEDVAGTRLKRLSIDVGDGTPMDVCTAATNVKEGLRVVVACVGARVGDEIVKKTTVKGVPSSGMLCDSVMLGWSGGGAGAAVVLTDDALPLGAQPPKSRPRPAGK